MDSFHGLVAAVASQLPSGSSIEECASVLKKAISGPEQDEDHSPRALYNKAKAEIMAVDCAAINIGTMLLFLPDMNVHPKDMIAMAAMTIAIQDASFQKKSSEVLR